MSGFSRKIIACTAVLSTVFMVTGQQLPDEGLVLDSIDIPVEESMDMDAPENSGMGPVLFAGQKAAAPLLDTLHTLSLAGAAFYPFMNTTPYYNFSYAYLRQTGSGVMKAPVNLPHGARVRELRAYFYRDTSVTGTIRVYLRRRTLSTNSMVNMANVSSTGTGNHNRYDNTISYNPINNLSYSYMVYAYFPSVPAAGRARLHSVRIRYFHVY